MEASVMSHHTAVSSFPHVFRPPHQLSVIGLSVGFPSFTCFLLEYLKSNPTHVTSPVKASPGVLNSSQVLLFPHNHLVSVTSKGSRSDSS